uniref:Thioredoxin-related transmembrane protein 1-like n=1 Tax=Phallusia mammillata TaxID=59560 RepID=A0A6F9DUL7_9ASCI|nr:thioredoxin-related transmembrane protein 1-like [Phallusia mammillata]
MSWALFAVQVICLLASTTLVSCRKTGKIIVLDDSNWKNSLKGQWMIKFYAPWCPACRANEEDYKAFSDWSEDLQINVAMIDITKEAGLSGRFMVTALPSFYFGKDGEFWRYNGLRTADAMHDYVEGELWKNNEPVWWVRHPDSIQMTMMSWLFKTSVIMKNVHDSLTENYGLSTWVSYAIFGVGTIITGLVLGLLLVCITDFISPSKPTRRPPKATEGPFHVPEDLKTNAEEEEKSRKEKRARESEEEDTGDEGSAVATDDEVERASQHSQESMNGSQASSRASQEWETIHALEVADAEHDSDEPDTQVRQRKNVPASQTADADTKEAGDGAKTE